LKAYPVLVLVKFDVVKNKYQKLLYTNLSSSLFLDNYGKLKEIENNFKVICHEEQHINDLVSEDPDIQVSQKYDIIEYVEKLYETWRLDLGDDLLYEESLDNDVDRTIKLRKLIKSLLSLQSRLSKSIKKIERNL
jgi:hypothetical protein